MFIRKRKKGERYTEFADSFRGIAQTHLNYFQRPLSDQEEQHIALIQLDNAELPGTNNNKLMSILVNKADDPERGNTKYRILSS